MGFDDLTTCFERLEALRGRLQMYQVLGELFSQAKPDEIAPLAYLCEARLTPAFAGSETRIGEKMAAAAIAAASETTPQPIQQLYHKLGD